MNLFAVFGITVLSVGLALAGAGGSLRVILYLLMRNQVASAQSAPAPAPVHETIVQETTSVAA